MGLTWEKTSSPEGWRAHHPTKALCLRVTKSLFASEGFWFWSVCDGEGNPLAGGHVALSNNAKRCAEGWVEDNG